MAGAPLGYTVPACRRFFCSPIPARAWRGLIYQVRWIRLLTLYIGHTTAAASAVVASLRFDAHDSTGYTNLGLLELAWGNRSAAARYFAEALWLDPASRVAREDLARGR